MADPYDIVSRQVWYRPSDVRRVVLGHLIAAGGPVALDDLMAAVVDELDDRFSTPRGRTEIAEVVRHQIRSGRVRRVRRGVYEYVPGSLSTSTEWRCRNWRAERIRSLEAFARRWAS
jgi:hypothetical protein